MALWYAARHCRPIDDYLQVSDSRVEKVTDLNLECAGRAQRRRHFGSPELASWRERSEAVWPLRSATALQIRHLLFATHALRFSLVSPTNEQNSYGQRTDRQAL